MTWNPSEKELIKLLEEANTWHTNIKLGYKIGQCLPFLDVLLMNNNGILQTSVYHKQGGMREYEYNMYSGKYWYFMYWNVLPCIQHASSMYWYELPCGSINEVLLHVRSHTFAYTLYNQLHILLDLCKSFLKNMMFLSLCHVGVVLYFYFTGKW